MTYPLKVKLHNKKDYFLLETPDELLWAENHILQYDLVAFDSETDGLNVRKNKTIGYSFSTEVGNGFYIPLWEFDGKDLFKLENLYCKKKLLKALSTKKLIMHNGAFDTKIIFNDLDVDLLSSLYADTQLMRHTLQEEGPFALKDIAVELQAEIGIDSDEVANQEQLELEQNVKAKGGSWTKDNKEMFKADLPILAKYACADTDLTLRLYHYFQKKLEQEGLLDFFYKDEVMPLYTLVTIPMEFEGVHLDLPTLEVLNTNIGDEIEKTKQYVVDEILKSQYGADLIELLLRDYEVSNKGSFAQALCAELHLPLPINEKGKYSLTKKSINTLPDNSIKTFLLEDASEAWLGEELIKNIKMRMLKEDEPMIINISSKQQLGKLAFEVMGLQPLSKTEKGSPQFNEAFLDTIKEPWAQELRVYNKLSKIKGSYYERFLKQQEDGIFYPTFKQFGTTSGRYGSDMQQLSRPVEEDSDDPRVVKYINSLRKLFIPKKDHVYIDDDYESLEPRTFADDASDQALIDIFELGEDFYSKVAIQAENLKNVSADKKHPNFLKNKFPEVRQNAKAYSLGIRYGMKAGKLSMSLGISLEEAQEIIDGYFKAFPNLKIKMDQYLLEAKTKGRVTSKYGRVRHLPRVKAIYEKYGDDIADYKKLYPMAKKFYKSVDDLKQLRKEYNNSLNNALNFPIQAAAASIVNRAMIAMTRKFRALGLEAWVSLQIHDQVVVTCLKSQTDTIKAIVQDCMENTNKLAMKLIAKPEVASNLADGH